MSTDQTLPPYDAATDHVSVLALLLTAIERQLFAAGVLRVYADRRLDLEPRCRRAAIQLLRDM